MTERKSATDKEAAATKSGASEPEVKLPGTGEDTPDVAKAEEERRAAAENAVNAVADFDPNLDPYAQRDRVRNVDDSATSNAVDREETVANSDGPDPRLMTMQVAQFDESGGGSVLRSVAYPSKAALRAEKASRPGGVVRDEEDTDKGTTSDSTEESRRAAATKSAGDDESAASRRSSARKSSSSARSTDKK